jgi:formylglycine-generating enzyme required for sulfatase activity
VVVVHRTSIERFARDRQRFDEFSKRIQEWSTEAGAACRHRRSLCGDALLDLIRPVRHPHVMHEVCGFGATHREPEVRRLLLRFAEERAHAELAARELVVWLLSDDEDFVVFEAIRLAGRCRIGEAVGELLAVSGPASTLGSTKPVGVGASLVRDSLQRIFGTTDHHLLRELEQAYMDEGGPPPETLWADRSLYRPDDLPDVPGMVRIPGGEFVVGVDATEVPEPVFDVTDAMPRRVEYLPDFLIDSRPAINAEYDAWAATVEATTHELCHPDEPEGKDHGRGSRRDRRFGGDHPVVGVDWFDAYAYLAAHGKELPSELEWERAARGVDGRHYPWGDEWDPEATQWAGRVFGRDISDLEIWRGLLRSHDEAHPAVTTVSAGSNPRGRTPEGVADLAGNAWEWTRTNFFTRAPMNPMTSGRARPEWATAAESFAVIRGGAWSSYREQLAGYFRGRDLLTDRHNEITFRGVIR